MSRFLHLLDALRVAALWLLMGAVFLGPAGLGGSAAIASMSKPCGVSCPCDEAPHAEHANAHDEAEPCDDASTDSDHDDTEPCEDECPNDCPNCGCCLGIAMAVLPLPITSSAVACTSARKPTPLDAPASGAGAGVFRPPRGLA